MTVKSDNPNVKSVKHMAFAVSDAEAALNAYAKFLHVPADTEVTSSRVPTSSASRSKGTKRRTARNCWGTTKTRTSRCSRWRNQS